jgi:hypothetical protein
MYQILWNYIVIWRANKFMTKLVKLKLPLATVIAVFAGVISFLSSCKENTILPPDLVPVIDNINTFQADSFSLITHNIYQDSLLTGGSLNGISVSKNANLYHALGTINSNADFGFTHASFHVEVLPPSSNYTHKGFNPVFDSIVLTIPFKGTFGDTINGPEQYLLAYRSLKSFSKDSAQYEFTKDSFDISQPIGSYTIDFNKFKKDSSNKTIRIKLASWVADSLKAQMDSLNVGGATSSYTKFLAWWKGFYITSISAQGSTLGYFNTYGTRMLVYYRYSKDVTNTDIDTTMDVFGFDPTYCNRFNSIERRYKNSKSNQYLYTGSMNGDSTLFIQNLPGLATEIKFPHLANFSNVLVNKAELNVYSTIPMSAMLDTSIYGLVPRFQIFRVENGLDKIIGEYASFGSGFIDAKRRTVTINGQKYLSYKILLTQTMQKLISQKDTSLRLKLMGLTDVYPGAYGTMLKGSSSAMDSLRPKLYMIYTKIN